MAVLELELQRSPERPASIAAHLSVQDAVAPEGERGPISAMVDGELPTVLVLGNEAQDHPSIVAQAAVLHERGVRVRSLTLFYEEWLGKLPISELERASMLFDIGEVHRQGYGRAKRIIDVPLAAVGVVLLGVLLPFVLMLNLGGTAGPLFYRQTRVGKGGQPLHDPQAPDHDPWRCRRHSQRVDRARRPAGHAVRARCSGAPTSTSCRRS